METNNDMFIWVEKYRPQKVADCILPNRLKSFFSEIVKGDSDNKRKPLDTLKGFQEGEALVLYAQTEHPFSYGITSRFSFGGHG